MAPITAFIQRRTGKAVYAERFAKKVKNHWRRIFWRPKWHMLLKRWCHSPGVQILPQAFYHQTKMTTVKPTEVTQSTTSVFVTVIHATEKTRNPPQDQPDQPNRTNHPPILYLTPTHPWTAAEGCPGRRKTDLECHTMWTTALETRWTTTTITWPINTLIMMNVLQKAALSGQKGCMYE